MARLGDLVLESGEVLQDYAQSYVAHGSLNAEKSNAVLVCISLTGNHHRLDFLIGPGRALDPARYFIVVADPIGNGLYSGHGRKPVPFVNAALRTCQFACGHRRIDGWHAGLAVGRELPAVHVPLRANDRDGENFGLVGTRDRDSALLFDGGPGLDW